MDHNRYTISPGPLLGEEEIRQRLFYIVTTVFGVTLFVWLLMQIGLGEIIQNIKIFGRAIILFILLEGIATIFYAWATRYCFMPESRTLSLWSLWKITTSERAISYITPFAGMGGDVVKWSILERYCSPAEAASVVMIYKLGYTLSKLLFCLIWAVPIFALIPLPLALKIPLLLGTAFLGAGLMGFLIFQKKGLFGASLNGTMGKLLGSGARNWIASRTAAFDSHLIEYHRDHKRDFWITNFILWFGFAIGGILQAWVFAVVVLKVTSPVVPLVVWILGSWFDMVVFFVPAGIGTKEFARVLIFQAMKFPAAVGASFALVLRIEELFWAAVGLVVYVFMRPTRSPGGEKETTP